MRARATFTAAGGMLVVGSCLVDGFVLLDPLAGAGGSGATASAGGSGAAGTGGLGCGHARWPDAPSDTDPGADVALIAALRELDIGETAVSRGPQVGYDLDSFCTCQGEGPSCVQPDGADADPCDGPQGRDNAVARLFEAASVFLPELSSAALTTQVAAGRFSLLLRVRGYNGQPNDATVEVALFASPGRDRDPCLGMPPLPPSWDGNDAWPVASTSLEPPQGSGGGGGSGGAGSGGGCGASGYDLEAPRFVDARAYVSDGVLVASFADAELLLRSESSMAPVHLVAAVVSARLVARGASFALEEGLVVGRWPVEELRQAFVPLAAGGQPVCTDDSLYGNLKNAVCDHPDVATGVVGPTTPCDAVSFGMAFRAEPAQLGSVWEVPASTSPCPVETDPAGDSCATP